MKKSKNKKVNKNKKLHSKKALKKKQDAKYIKKGREKTVLRGYQAELIVLQKHLEATGKKMVVIFEGRDAAGKGGVIKRVLEYSPPKHVRPVALGKPTNTEKGQNYFQRYFKHLPTVGEIVLFDRSWYNRAMVEPVFGFCTEEEYKSFIKHVPSHEKIIQMDGTIFIKIYFSVSKKVQKDRFNKRKKDRCKQWKLSEVDLQAQKYWEKFSDVKLKMLEKTSTTSSPWHVIRSDNKHLARVEAMKLILNSVDYKGRNKKLDYCLDEKIVISGARELEKMRRAKHRSGKF